MYRLMVKKMVETNLAITLLSGLYNFKLLEVPNDPCDSTGMLNVDKGITLIDNKLQTLQLRSVLQTMNASLRSTFLNARFVFIPRAFQHPNARSAFHYQNAKPAFNL